MLNVIISHTCKEVVEIVVVAKPVTQKKFVQIRGKQWTAGTKLSFKLTISTHTRVFNVLSVNFTIMRINKVMLYYIVHIEYQYTFITSIYIAPLQYMYNWLHYLVKL